MFDSIILQFAQLRVGMFDRRKCRQLLVLKCERFGPLGENSEGASEAC